MRLPGMLLLSLLVACSTAQDRKRDPGHLAVNWAGSDRGRLSGAATAEWCASDRRLEIRGIRGDTGVGLALYPPESIVPGSYPVVDPVRAESVPPAAAVVLRWVTQTTVQGFQAESGTVDLKRSVAGLLSGGFKVRARSVVDTQKLSVTGAFQDLTVGAATRGCGPTGEPPAARAEARDTSVH